MNITRPIRVFKSPTPGLQHLIFEYHSQIGKVYKIDKSRKIGEKYPAEVIAEHCDTEARAFGFVQTWCRGFRAGQASVPNLNIIGSN